MDFIIISLDTPEYEQMVNLRSEILRKPLGLSFTENELKDDEGDILFGAFLPNGGEIVACCILKPLESGVVKLRQMAVDKEMQRKEIGTAMLSFAEYVATKEGFDQIVLHAREVAMGFYLKYGYEVIGESFLEVGIPHYKMAKHLSK